MNSVHLLGLHDVFCSYKSKISIIPTTVINQVYLYLHIKYRCEYLRSVKTDLFYTRCNLVSHLLHGKRPLDNIH